MKYNTLIRFIVVYVSLIIGFPSIVRAENEACHRQLIQVVDKDFVLKEIAYYPLIRSYKTILILPPLMGTTGIEKAYAKMLCHKGFQAFILDKWTGDDDLSIELESNQRLIERSQRAIGLAIQNAAPSSYIGILGTSLGATYAEVASCLFPDVDAVFAIVGGVSFASIIADSDLPVIIDLNQKRFEKYGFRSREEYVQALENAIPWDPIKIKTGFENKKLGMVIATKDTAIRTKYQLLLKKLWEPRVSYWFNQKHEEAIASMFLYKKEKILKFFKNSNKIKGEIL